jgi:hypothetical protein
MRVDKLAFDEEENITDRGRQLGGGLNDDFNEDYDEVAASQAILAEFRPLTTTKRRDSKTYKLQVQRVQFCILLS